MTMKDGPVLESGTYVQCFPVVIILYAHQYSLYSIPDPFFDRSHSQLVLATSIS